MWSTPGIALRRSRTGPGEKICAVNKYKKLVFRHRQKIFTTNNHYEWSKYQSRRKYHACIENASRPRYIIQQRLT
jgi:hypothetical protein